MSFADAVGCGIAGGKRRRSTSAYRRSCSARCTRGKLRSSSAKKAANSSSKSRTAIALSWHGYVAR